MEKLYETDERKQKEAMYLAMLNGKLTDIQKQELAWKLSMFDLVNVGYYAYTKEGDFIHKSRTLQEMSNYLSITISQICNYNLKKIESRSYNIERGEYSTFEEWRKNNA